MLTVLVPCDAAPHRGLGLGREPLRMALAHAGPAWIVRCVCRAFRAGRAAEAGVASDAVTSLERALLARRSRLSRGAAFNAAMSAGRLDILEAMTRGCEWIDCHVRDDTWRQTAERGHLATLQWVAAFGYRVAPGAWVGAATAARMDVLDWLRSAAGPPTDVAIRHGIECGHLGVVQLMYALVGRMPWWSIEVAARTGCIDVLDWLESIAPHWVGARYGPCKAAAEGGHLAALRWLRRRHYPWRESTTSAAAHNGHFAVFLYARAHGCRVRSDAHQATLGY
jgi:hypothetical protein